LQSVLLFPLTVEFVRVTVPDWLKTPPPESMKPEVRVIVTPETCTAPEEIERVLVPFPFPSRVAPAVPCKVRSLAIVKFPMQVPVTPSVDPGEAASIAGCRAEEFALQSTGVVAEAGRAPMNSNALTSATEEMKLRTRAGAKRST
jgi:hypothetical protein